MAAERHVPFMLFVWSDATSSSVRGEGSASSRAVKLIATKGSPPPGIRAPGVPPPELAEQPAAGRLRHLAQLSGRRQLAERLSSTKDRR